MSYEVRVHRRVEKFLKTIPKEEKERIKSLISFGDAHALHRDYMNSIRKIRRCIVYSARIVSSC